MADNWTLDGIEPPAGISLLAHIESLLPASGRGPLPEGGEPLPDAQPRKHNEVGWAAGARDAVLQRRGEHNDPLIAATAVTDALRGKRKDTKVRAAVARMDELRGPEAMDRFIRTLRTERRIDKLRLAALARWVCRHEGRRGAVKAGIALLGVAGAPEDAALIERLGLADELTLYSVVALNNLLAEPDEAIYRLGQQVTGWGRIHAVRHLAATEKPHIRGWLLRGGAENDIGIEETAFIAVTAGHLKEALQKESDDALLDHGGRLLSALAAGGPSRDNRYMSDYADGCAAMRAYVERMSGADPTLDRLECLVMLEWYLHNSAKEKAHLTAADIELLAAHISSLLRDRRWVSLAWEKLTSDDAMEMKKALPLCARFGQDATQTVMAWLRREPTDGYLWQWVLSNVPLVDALTLTEELLPLESLASGPADDPGVGPSYGADFCLGQILQRLHQAPGEGWPIIRTAIRNRVVGNRSYALDILKSWPRSSWPSDAGETLLQAMWREPDDKVRLKLSELSSIADRPE